MVQDVACESTEPAEGRVGEDKVEGFWVLFKEVSDSVEGLFILVEVPSGCTVKATNEIASTAARFQHSALKPTVFTQCFMNEFD